MTASKRRNQSAEKQGYRRDWATAGSRLLQAHMPADLKIHCGAQTPRLTVAAVQVYWDQGATMGGSSGSPLVDVATRRVVSRPMGRVTAGHAWQLGPSVRKAGLQPVCASSCWVNRTAGRVIGADVHAVLTDAEACEGGLSDVSVRTVTLCGLCRGACALWHTALALLAAHGCCTADWKEL